jgi:hypothetical protein
VGPCETVYIDKVWDAARSKVTALSGERTGVGGYKLTAELGAGDALLCPQKKNWNAKGQQEQSQTYGVYGGGC